MKSISRNEFFSTPETLNISGKLLDISKPRVMGILNVTPDSFFDGGMYTSEADIVKQTGRMLQEGASFIDVGAYSSRPGADDISEHEEIRRATTAIRSIIRSFPEAIVSIDTFRTAVAHAAIEEGAKMINDISAGEMDLSLPQLAAHHGLPYVAMHMRGNPSTMTSMTQYSDLIKDIVDFFHKKLLELRVIGLKDVIIDPGFGFAKTRSQNFALLNDLEYFGILNRPILVGISRKSMIWKTLSQTPDDALNGTTSLNTIALMKGANILRVHDVKQAVEAIQLVDLTQGKSLDKD